MAEVIIHKSKLFSNLNILKNTIKAQIAAVIKDNAYGHGIVEISNLLVEFGISSVFVKNNFEANLVRDKFEHITILYPDSFENISDNIYLSISSIEALEKLEKNVGIELKVNTGMNRNGIESSELELALNIIKSRNIRLIGVFSHNAYGDSGENGTLVSDFIKQQELFSKIKSQVIEFTLNNNLPKPRFHSLSSSGAIKLKDIDDDLVRIGIAMYGYLGYKCEIETALKPIAEVWSEKISSRFLAKGSKIGYEGKYILENDCIVSSYDIGYGDGFFRLKEGQDLHTKEGFKILPRMSMDSTSIISNENKVCVLYDANKMANVFGTISYEILCRISPFIKRIIKD